MKSIWFITISVLFFYAFNIEGFGNDESGDAIPNHFKSEIRSLIKKHISLSLDYMYTGSGYANQRVQRPGMAKKLRELSDTHWEDGIKNLQKYFQRGGRANLINKRFFTFEGKSVLDLSLSATKDMRVTYLLTLENLVRDSKECLSLLNALHNTTTVRKHPKHGSFHDGDWSYYFSEQMQSEVSRTRALQGLATSLNHMNTSSLGLHIFDSYL